MKILSLNKAKENLGNLINETVREHGPVYIKGRNHSAVLLIEDDWNAIQETLYLLSIPGMRKSVLEGLKTPLSKCSKELTW